MGTSGSVDGNSQLIIKGRFQQKQIENVLRRYIKEYVTCHTCRSPDTILQKDTRLFFLQCETCGSRCSVASIKSGFQVNYYIYVKNNFKMLNFTFLNFVYSFFRLSPERELLFVQKLPKHFSTQFCNTGIFKGIEIVYKLLYLLYISIEYNTIIFGWNRILNKIYFYLI